MHLAYTHTFFSYTHFFSLSQLSSSQLIETKRLLREQTLTAGTHSFIKFVQKIEKEKEMERVCVRMRKGERERKEIAYYNKYVPLLCHD